MITFLSKLLPLFVYPLGLTCILIFISLLVKKNRAVGKWLTIIALVLLYLASNRWVSLSLVRSLEWRYFPPEPMPEADVIVVLGGGTESPGYPRPLTEVNGAGDRLIYAAYLYQQGAAPSILVSGGTIDWQEKRSTTPAQDMSALLSIMNVPPEAIIEQGESINTYEDALFSSRILRERGLTKVILVTSALHMPRSVALFEQMGIAVIPAPTDYTISEIEYRELTQGSLESNLINLLPTASNLKSTTSSLKEYLGMLVYRLED